MDNATLDSMQSTLDSVKTRTESAIHELNQDHYQNALFLLKAIILDLSNVAYVLNEHLLYRTPKE